MNILVIDMWFPTPDRDSASLRMANLLTLLAHSSHRVTFTGDDFASHGRPSVHALEAAGVNVACAPAVRSVEDLLTQRGHEFDLVILSRYPVAEKYAGAVRTWTPNARLIFDTVDLHYLRGFRGARVSGNRSLLRLAMETKRIEFAAMRAADCTLVVSPVEQEILASECPEATVHVLSNIHHVVDDIPGFRDRCGIFFVGTFTHHPNVDAMSYFCEAIYPLLTGRLDPVHVDIIGSAPPAWLQQRRSAQLTVTGYVPDMAPFLARSRLSIAPLRYGAGVKGKVLLSMGHGVPVVASSIAAEGMPVVDGRDILIADDPESFSRQVIRLHQDEALWQQLSEHGRQVVADHFSFAAARRNLEGVFGSLGLTVPAGGEPSP